MSAKTNPSFNAPWNEVFTSSMAMKCTGMRSKISQVEAVGKHLQLTTQPCTNVSCNFSSKPITGAADDPVINCRISVSSIPGTPKKN